MSAILELNTIEPSMEIVVLVVTRIARQSPAWLLGDKGIRTQKQEQEE